MLKIYFTGPESTGKTSLCQQLSAHYSCPWVLEYARQYLNETEGKYKYADLREISKGQIALEDAFLRGSEKFMFCDTGHIVLQIWSMHKFGKVDPIIENRARKQKGSLHLLCKPDLKWEADPLRENQIERDILFQKYQHLLEAYNIDYAIVDEHNERRVEKAIALVDQFLR